MILRSCFFSPCAMKENRATVDRNKRLMQIIKTTEIITRNSYAVSATYAYKLCKTLTNRRQESKVFLFACRTINQISTESIIILRFDELKKNSLNNWTIVDCAHKVANLESIQSLIIIKAADNQEINANHAKDSWPFSINQ